MKYLIEPRRQTSSIPICSAQGDAGRIAMSQGYEPYYIQSSAGKGLLGKVKVNLSRISEALLLSRKLSSDDTVLMQWPAPMGQAFPLYLLGLRAKRPSLVVLVHDINVLRGGG